MWPKNNRAADWRFIWAADPGSKGKRSIFISPLSPTLLFLPFDQQLTPSSVSPNINIRLSRSFLLRLSLTVELQRF